MEICKFEQYTSNFRYDEISGCLNSCKYIRSLLKEDKECEQLTMIELFDPFTGEPLRKTKSKP